MSNWKYFENVLDFSGSTTLDLKHIFNNCCLQKYVCKCVVVATMKEYYPTRRVVNLVFFTGGMKKKKH